MTLVDMQKLIDETEKKHGKSGFLRTVMGSVADEVVRKSGKPVLVIRPKSRK